MKPFSILKTADDKFKVIGASRGNMGTYKTQDLADKRIAELNQSLNLSSLYKEAKEHKVAFTYSATIRFLRSEYPDFVSLFLKKFKEIFDQACQNQDLGLDAAEKSLELEKICLMEAVKSLGNFNDQTP